MASHLIIYNASVFCSLIAGIFFLKAKRTSEFIVLIVLSQVAFILDVVCYGVSAWFFCRLLLLDGPLLYFIYLKDKEGFIALKSRWVHLIPLFLVLVKDGIYFVNDSRVSMDSFHDINLLIVGIVQLSYAAWICNAQRNNYDPQNSKATFIRHLSFLFILNGIVNIFVHLNGLAFRVNFGFNEDILLYLCMLPPLVLMLKYVAVEGLFQNKPSGLVIEPTLSEDGYKYEMYRYSSLEEHSLMEIEARIRFCLVEEKLYLQPDLTMDDFSRQINISKNQISQVLNTYMGKNFYRVLADYRIAHAEDILKTNKNLKIEALAYDCGFNSLSSFNRYFREITGFQPSTYLRNLENERENANPS